MKARSARLRSVLRERACLDCDPPWRGHERVLRLALDRRLNDGLSTLFRAGSSIAIGAGANVPVTGTARVGKSPISPCLPMCMADVRRHVIRASLRWRSSDAPRRAGTSVHAAARARHVADSRHMHAQMGYAGYPAGMRERIWAARKGSSPTIRPRGATESRRVGSAKPVNAEPMKDEIRLSGKEPRKNFPNEE